MKIFAQSDKLYDAVNSVVEIGVAAVHGTKGAATAYCECIIGALKPYEDIEPAVGYQNVQNQGYLYYVYDITRFSSGDPELIGLVHEIDKSNPCPNIV